MNNPTSLDPLLLRRDLLLREAIEHRLDQLVRQANKVVLRLQDSRMEKSQLRNLLNVAISTRSPEVVMNFIRYQIAREEDKWGKGKDDFGHVLLQCLQTEIKSWTGEVVQEIKQKMPDVPEGHLLSQHVYIELIRLFIGYLNRAFYYGKEVGDGFKHLQEIANA